MKDTVWLREIGLTKGESKVYMALLEIGQSSITAIIKKSGVSTSKSYDILHRLEEKGMVSHVIKSGIKYFKAAHPERLKEVVLEKQRELATAMTNIDKMMPTLLAKQKARETQEEAEIFVGLRGLATVFNEETEWMKQTKKESYVIGATRGGKAGRHINDFFRRLQEKRNQLRVKTMFVFNKAMRGNFPYLESSKYCSIRYIEGGSEMTSVNIFNDKVVIALYARQPFLFVIKSREVADDFGQYFHTLWKKGKK